MPRFLPKALALRFLAAARALQRRGSVAPARDLGTGAGDAEPRVTCLAVVAWLLAAAIAKWRCGVACRRRDVQ